MRVHLLISGAPAAGETRFGDWLRDRQGFLHIDMQDLGFKGSVLHTFWLQCGRTRAELFSLELRRLHPRVVLTGAFPASMLQTVRSLREGGMTPWRFDVDADAARREWMKKTGRKPSPQEDAEFGGLAAEHEKLAPFFGGKLLRTLDAEGRRLSYEEIASKMGIDAYP